MAGLGIDTTGNGNGDTIPDKGFTAATVPMVKAARFGDGYEQRKIMGINTIKQTFNVSFNNRTNDEIDDIEAFFETKGGVTNFLFTVPDSNSATWTRTNERDIKVVCDSWTKSHTYGDFYSLSAKLRRVYEA